MKALRSLLFIFLCSTLIICTYEQNASCYVNPTLQNTNLVNTVGQIQFYDLFTIFQGQSLFFQGPSVDYVNIRQTIHQQNNQVYTDKDYLNINGATYQDPDQIEIYYAILQFDPKTNNYIVFQGQGDNNHAPNLNFSYTIKQEDQKLTQCYDIEVITPQIIVVDCTQQDLTTKKVQNQLFLIATNETEAKSFLFDNFPYTLSTQKKLQTLYNSASNTVYIISAFPNYLVNNSTEKDYESKIQIYQFISFTQISFVTNVSGQDIGYGDLKLYANDFQTHAKAIYVLTNSSTVTSFEILNGKVNPQSLKTLVNLVIPLQAFAFNVVRSSKSELNIFIQYSDSLIQYFVINDQRRNSQFKFDSQFTDISKQILLGSSINYVTVQIGQSLNIYLRPLQLQTILDIERVYYNLQEIIYFFSSNTDTFLGCYQKNCSNYLISRPLLIVTPNAQSADKSGQIILGTSVGTDKNISCQISFNIVNIQDPKNETMIPSQKTMQSVLYPYDSNAEWYKTFVPGEIYYGPDIQITVDTADPEVAIYEYNRVYHFDVPGQDTLQNQFLTVPQLDNVEEVYINSASGFLSCSDNNTYIDCSPIPSSLVGLLVGSYVNQFGTSQIMTISNMKNQVSIYKQSEDSISIMDIIDFGENVNRIEQIKYQTNWVHFKDDIYVAIITDIGNTKYVGVYTNGRVDIVINNASVSQWPGFANGSITFNPLNVQTTQYLPYILMIDCSDNTLFVSLLSNQAQFVNVIPKTEQIQNCKPFLFNTSLVLVKKISDAVYIEEYSLANVNNPVLLQTYQLYDYQLLINEQMFVQKSDSTNSLYFLALQNANNNAYQSLVLLIFKVNKPYTQTLYKTRVIKQNVSIDQSYPMKINVATSNVYKMTLNNDVRDYVLITYNNLSVLLKYLPQDQFYIRIEKDVQPQNDFYWKQISGFVTFEEAADFKKVEKQFSLFLFHNQTKMSLNRDGVQNSGVKSVMNQKSSSTSYNFDPDQWFFGSVLNVGLEPNSPSKQFEIINRVTNENITNPGWKQIKSAFYDQKKKIIWALNNNNSVFKLNQDLQQVGKQIDLISTQNYCFKIVPGYNYDVDLIYMYIFCTGNEVIGLDPAQNQITYPLQLKDFEEEQTLGYIHVRDSQVFVQKLSKESVVNVYQLRFSLNLTVLIAQYNSSTLNIPNMPVVNINQFSISQTNASSTYRKILLTVNYNQIVIVNVNSVNYQEILYIQVPNPPFLTQLLQKNLFVSYQTKIEEIRVLHQPVYDPIKKIEYLDVMVLTSNTALYHFNISFVFKGEAYSFFDIIDFIQVYNNYGSQLAPRVYDQFQMTNVRDYYLQSSGMSHYHNLIMVVYQFKNQTSGQTTFYPIIYDTNKKNQQGLSTMQGGFVFNPQSQDYQVYTFYERSNGQIAMLADNEDNNGNQIIKYQDHITVNIKPNGANEIENELIFFALSKYIDDGGVVPQFSAQVSYVNNFTPKPSNHTWLIVIIVLSCVAVVSLGAFLYIRYRKKQKAGGLLSNDPEQFKSVYSENQQ